jgi:hypothetical protein
MGDIYFVQLSTVCKLITKIAGLDLWSSRIYENPFFPGLSPDSFLPVGERRRPGHLQGSESEF